MKKLCLIKRAIIIEVRKQSILYESNLIFKDAELHRIVMKAAINSKKKRVALLIFN